MAKSVTSDVIKLKNVRLSFAQLFEAKPFDPGKPPKFSATFILDPTNAEHAATIAEVKAAMAKIAAEGLPGIKLGPEQLCLKNGNTKAYDGWKDMIVLVASNNSRPVVVDGKLVPVMAGDKNAPYSGCYVNATVTLWTQKNQYGTRINGNLRAVQFVKDGPAFGVAPVDADDEFEALGDTADTSADTSAGPGLADFDIG